MLSEIVHSFHHTTTTTDDDLTGFEKDLPQNVYLARVTISFLTKSFPGGSVTLSFSKTFNSNSKSLRKREIALRVKQLSDRGS